ncbi:HNH endonuclease signature motif containing protein [Corynebacterium flavescens]|uniref:HNH endonuclease signature motif containing protein n=1 Tax=Corynebacterium flavescens TaxID=28028 RepID=UPI003FD1BCAF
MPSTTATNSAAIAATAIRKQEYELWQSIKPPLEADVEIECHCLSTTTGLSESKTKNIISALYRLEELPKLKELQELHFHLDLNRLITIDATLCKLGNDATETLERIDAEIARYLTVSRPCQHLPSARAIRNKINALIAQEDESLSTQDSTEPEDTYHVFALSSTRSCLSAEYDSATALILDEHIRQTAENLDVSPAEALARLIKGEAAGAANVKLHVYRASDVHNAPAFVKAAGWIYPDVADQYCATSTRDIDAAATATSKSYSTPAHIGAFVEGRDGTCRWPGCSRQAHQCQKDHRIDFAAGGPTAASNLASLCQHHHNIKTDGRAFYIMDPFTGDIVWLFENGRWEYDEATGPLAPKAKNWVQSVGQAITRRRDNAHDDAKKD